jgi:hypothetical protein
MMSLSVVALASFAAISTNSTFVVIEAQSDGSSTRLSDAFPSLDDEALDTLCEEGFVILPFNGYNESRVQLERINHDLEQRSTLVSATITQITERGERFAYACRDGVIEAVEG